MDNHLELLAEAIVLSKRPDFFSITRQLAISREESTVSQTQNLWVSKDCVIHLGYDAANCMLKERIMEVERQHDLGATSSNMFLDKTLLPFKPANYIYLMPTQKHRRAYNLAHLNALPSAVQEGKYMKIPYSQCKCPCNSGTVETITHALLCCPFYRDFRRSHI